MLCYQGNQAVVIGVVPWLGTFITDLVMIDSACDNHTPEGYINFDKCRKVRSYIICVVMQQINLLSSVRQEMGQ